MWCSWLRGRLLALGFTLPGITVAACLVGRERLGTAAGTVELRLICPPNIGSGMDVILPKSLPPP